MNVLRKVRSAVALCIAVYLTGITTLLVFRVFNRVRILGQMPFWPTLRRVQIVSNHETLIDSFLVGGIAGYPWLFLMPWKLPYQLADGRNFLSHWLMRHVYSSLRVISVDRNRIDTAALNRGIEVLTAGGILHVFIEGTRSTTGELLPPKIPAIGMALRAEADILPVYFEGMDTVQPYRKKAGDGDPTWLRPTGRAIHRFMCWISRNRIDSESSGDELEWLLDMRSGQRVTINFGQIISAAEAKQLAGEGKASQQRRQLADAIMERLRSLKEETDRVHHGHTKQRLAH